MTAGSRARHQPYGTITRGTGKWRARLTATEPTIRWAAWDELPTASRWPPSPGTKRVKWLEQNVAALDITLTPGELALLDPLAAQVTGARY